MTSTVIAQQTDRRCAEPATGWFGEYTLHSSDGDGHGPMVWQVSVAPGRHGLIQRAVLRGAENAELTPWAGCPKTCVPDEVIWPAWTPSLDRPSDQRDNPLSGARERWSGLANRLRDSAKWMSTVLGAALALLLGTSPLSALAHARFDGTAVICGVAGLILLSATLLLLLMVLRPAAVSFADVQLSDQRGIRSRLDPLVRWKQVVERQQDLYLPCGINSLTGLRHSVIVEEATLAALARAIQDATAKCLDLTELIEARTVRAARLHDLKDAVGEIAAIGEFYKVRQRSLIASVLGVLFTGTGLVCIVAALMAAQG